MHFQEGTVTIIPLVDKMRLFDPGEWLRISFDVRLLVAHVRGEMFLKSKMQSGQHPMMVYLRRVSTLVELQVAEVMGQISAFLKAKFDIDLLPSHLSVYIPRNVPLPAAYTMLDLLFLCAVLESDMEAFLDDRKILRLRVVTTLSMAPLSADGESCLS